MRLILLIDMCWLGLELRLNDEGMPSFGRIGATKNNSEGQLVRGALNAAELFLLSFLQKTDLPQLLSYLEGSGQSLSGG